MSKICIVTTRNIFDAPCLEKYRQLIQEDFDIVYWDRCSISENCGASKYYRFDGTLSADASKLSKLKLYIGFYKFAKKILRENNYEKLIVFPTQTAWLILKELRTGYRGKYILDIRDYAGENNYFINKLTSSAIKHSGLCSITSEAYQKFLTEHKYIISHNVQPIDLSLVEQYRARQRADGPIVLSFIGSVRFIKQQEKLIALFGNDERFQLRFIGRGSEQLKSFCEKGNYKNVELVGRFERNQLGEFYLGTDMAINIYGNNNPYLDYALSNKLYSAAMMGMPILVSPDTYMAEIAEEFGFGLAVNVEDGNVPDKVYNYFKNISADEIFSGCDRFLIKVEKDEEKYSEAINKFLLMK